MEERLLGYPAGLLRPPCHASPPAGSTRAATPSRRTGEVDWGAGTEAERAACKEKFGGQSTVLRADALKTALGRLCKQKAAGVDTTANVFLRRAFNDGDANTFDTGLYPFASMCLAGTLHPEAMAFLLASRLALVPKVDDDD